MTNQFLVLGIPETASDSEIDEAFLYLSKSLNPTNFPVASQAEEQAEKCMSRVVPAYQELRDAANRARCRDLVQREKELAVDPNEFKPYLGHICVSAGIITIEDLVDAVDRQSDIDLPLGQILQEKQLLSQTELDGLLMGQRLFGSPPPPRDPLMRRLLALSVISRDMVKIAMLDQRTAFGSSICDLLLKRGWLNPQILQILMNQSASQQSTTSV